MAYKLKLKHVLNDLEDGDFKNENELKEVLNEFKKEDFIEHFINIFNEDRQEEIKENEYGTSKDEDF